MEASRTLERHEWASRWSGDEDDLSPEAREIYLPLAQMLGERCARTPSIVGVCGSVSVGKSTFCEALLPHLPGRVAVVSTDGFLLPNRELEARGILHRKGFPESYDLDLMDAFFHAVRECRPFHVPLYSHEVYDVTSRTQRVEPHDMVVIEGVASMLRPGSLDFSIYLDADEANIEAWFLQRVSDLRDGAKPDTFYWHFRQISHDEFLDLARNVWREVNLMNLRENIAPRRQAADIVLHKAADHRIDRVTLRSV